MSREPVDPTGTACVGKEPFDSGARASRAARNMGKHGKKVEIYRCPSCRCWHMGRGGKARRGLPRGAKL